MDEISETQTKWWKDKARDRWVPLPSERGSFTCKEAVAYYHAKDRCMYLTKKKEAPGHVNFTKLPEIVKQVFRKSREKEIRSLLDSGAIRILSVEESIAFEREHPDHVLTSRYVDRWKPTEDGSTLPEGLDDYNAKNVTRKDIAAKSRWTVVGWKDPEVHSIERSSPTPLTTSIYLALQTAACRRWRGQVRDVKTAFLQGRPTTRKQKLAVRMPSCEHFPGYDRRQLILLLTEVYGLVSGPSWWRRSLLEVLISELGYRLSAYDKCVLTLDADPNNKDENPEHTQGIIVVEIDDLLEAGSDRHRAKMLQLEKRFKFGKITDLMDAGDGSGYAGRRLRQRPDFSFSYSMNDYVANRLRKMTLNRKVTKKMAGQTVLSSDEQTQLRGVVAAINWTAREGRPDAAAAASILSGCFPDPKIADAWAVNAVVDHLKGTQVELVIHALEETSVRHVIISDASFDPSGRSKPQHGWLQAISTPALNAGERAPISLIAWKSRRMKRKAGNTLLCESIALSTAMGALEKQVATWKSFTCSNFRAKDLDDAEDLEKPFSGTPSVIAAEDKKYLDPAAVAIADAKSLFDALHSEQASGEDDRSALEIAIIQESLQKLHGRIRWIPHNFNPADGLTKLEGAHMQPLMKLLRTNHLMIEQEEHVLKQGKQSERRLKSSAC